MTATVAPAAVGTNSRLETLFGDVRHALLDVIKRRRITWNEYRAATQWLQLAGSQEHEIALLLDVFLSPAVDDANTPSGGATDSNVEGPFYVPGSATLEAPCVLPHRSGEPGEILFFCASVRSTGGVPLAGALLDVWQSDSLGEYSHIHPNVPAGNLRGRLVTDENGRCEVRTVMPVPYEIPKEGATGALLAALGRTAFRPAHIHVKLSHATSRTLTTQIYFEGDPWIDSDVVDAVKPGLVTRLERHDADSDARSRGLGRSYWSCAYDFVLDEVSSPTGS